MTAYHGRASQHTGGPFHVKACTKKQNRLSASQCSYAFTMVYLSRESASRFPCCSEVQLLFFKMHVERILSKRQQGLGSSLRIHKQTHTYTHRLKHIHRDTHTHTHLDNVWHHFVLCLCRNSQLFLVVPAHASGINMCEYSTTDVCGNCEFWCVVGTHTWQYNNT